MKTYKITFEFSTESDRCPLTWIPNIIAEVLEADETAEKYTSEETTSTTES